MTYGTCSLLPIVFFVECSLSICIYICMFSLAINMCFAEKAIYTQEVLAVVLQQLLDHSPVPVLFMRTVMSPQSYLQHNKSYTMYIWKVGLYMCTATAVHCRVANTHICMYIVLCGHVDNYCLYIAHYNNYVHIYTCPLYRNDCR